LTNPPFVRRAVNIWRRQAHTNPTERVLTALSVGAPRLASLLASAYPQPRDYALVDERLVERRGGRWLLRPAHYFQWHLFFNHADPVLDVLCHLARSSRFAVDAGANVGVYSVLMALAMAEGAVHAFEPGPETYERLVLHTHLNRAKNVTPIQRALGDQPGRLALTDSSQGDSGKASLRAQPQGSMVAEVEVTTLDAHMESLGLTALDLLKIDVEGHEPALLRGAQHALKAQPWLVLEFSPQWYDDADLAVFRDLEEMGYGFFEIDGPPVVLRPVSLSVLFARRQQCNLLGVPPRYRTVQLPWRR